MTFHVTGQRIDAHGSEARCKGSIRLDTGLQGRRDAFNPTELLHENVRKYGTVFNTVAPETRLTGSLVRLKQA